MKVRCPAVFGLVVCASVGLVRGAELPETWKHWAAFRPIELGPESDARLVGVAVPDGVLGAARDDLADLRVVDEAGGEVPFVLHARFGRSTCEWRAATLGDAGFVPGAYTQVVADTGAERAPHNTAELEITATDFFAWTEVAASDDRETWRVVRSRAPLFRFEKDGLAGASRISYPETTARWMRLRLYFAERDLGVRAVRMAREVVRPAELVPVAIELRRVADAPAGESRWEVSGEPALRASALRFATSRAAFHRSAEVRASDDVVASPPVVRGEIYRYPPPESDATTPEADREHLQLDFAEARGRQWRITVFDRNDPPIEDLRPQLLAVPRRIVFRPEPGATYRLLYGNARAEAPAYELARLIAVEELDAATPARVGAEVANDAHVSPEPWTERHPGVLWAALGLAVLALGVLALRSLR